MRRTAVLLLQCALLCAGELAELKLADLEPVPDSEPEPQEEKGVEVSKDQALFTHGDQELHCKERHLNHSCVQELRAYIADKDDETSKRTALTCVNDVLTETDDYWELKNMTHLLLDLDTVKHVFDRTSRDDEFVMAGLKFAQKLMEHPRCLEDFDMKGELETRCVPLYAKVSILKYKNAGMWNEARALFDRVSTMPWQGKQRTYAPGDAVPWVDFMQTPQIWVRGLPRHQVWERETWSEHLPICNNLEEHYSTIKDEIKEALISPTEAGFKDAYRFLYDTGSWDRVMLYHGRRFTSECETIFPRTCALLKQWLPSKPGLPWTSDQNEQAMVIKMRQGTDVETHSGPSNNILNIHLGVSGLEGAKLIVANKTYGWQEGKVFAWDGSFDHRVHCLECKEERVIFMLRLMHPNMAPKHYEGWERTHFEDIPLNFQ